MDHPTCIITGASRGLGAATARLAAQAGASVVLTARSLEELEQEAQKIQAAGGRALAIRGDISRAGDCRAILQQALDHFGRVDALINNGGMLEPIAPVAEANVDEWARNWAVNMLAPVLLTQLALPHLRPRGGKIINISSGAAVNVIGGWGAYSTAKAALNHFTKILAAEEPAITAISLRPGIVDTQMQATIRETGKGHMAESNYNRLNGLYESGQLLPPDVPGRAIACLALFAPHEWSGKIIQWDDAEVQELVKAKLPPG